MLLSISPIYGWGWFNKTKDIHVPKPFKLEADVDLRSLFQALGFFTEVDHPLSDMWIHVQQRHLNWDGHCNLTAFAQQPNDLAKDRPDISGFANVIIM